MLSEGGGERKGQYAVFPLGESGFLCVIFLMSSGGCEWSRVAACPGFWNLRKKGTPGQGVLIQPTDEYTRNTCENRRNYFFLSSLSLSSSFVVCDFVFGPHPWSVSMFVYIEIYVLGNVGAYDV